MGGENPKLVIKIFGRKRNLTEYWRSYW